MKKITPFFFLFLFIAGSLKSQCTINTSQTAPGLYPDSLPTGYVGQAYSQDVTFVMPLDTMGYPFTNFQILSVSLPVGLNWQCNNVSNGCNYNPQVSQYGCVNIYGTPLLAGQYNIDVTVIADLSIIQGVPVTFQIYMEVLPSNVSVSNGGFSMLGANGCLPVTVNFTNNNPGLLAYEWDFGNGNTSTQENPAPQIYTAQGDYVVNYAAYTDTTTTNVYTLTSVNLNIQNAWSWGFPTEGNPDPYFVIKQNGTTIYSSNYVQDDGTPPTWNLSLNLTPGNTYVMEVWDEDNYEFIYGGNDLIGTHTMSLNGCSGCAAGNDAVVNYTINHVVIPPVPSVLSVDTVHVNGYPGTPNIVFDSVNHVLSTDTTGYILQWYFNNSPISGGNQPTDTIFMSGDYFVVAINGSGCVAFSDTVTAVYCSGAAAPITVNNNVLSTPDTTSNSFQWYNSAGPISGATNSFYVATLEDSYYVIVTDEYGCKYTSNSVNIVLSVNEINASANIRLYPNPAQNNITLNWSGKEKMQSVRVTDLAGKTITQINQPENTLNIDISHLEKGIYLVETSGENFRVVKRFVKE